MSNSTTCQCQVDDRKIPALVIDNVCRRLFRSPTKFLSKYLSAGETVADLGCGPGFFTLPMAKLTGPRGRVYAVDFDPKVIARLERKAERQGLTSIVEPRAMSVSDIDFIGTGSVSFVLAEGLLCCMKDHAGAMEQIKRILKPDGRAYLSVIKFSRETDPRSVPRSEWAAILDELEVQDSGESPMFRWALVSKKSPKPAARTIAPAGAPA